MGESGIKIEEISINIDFPTEISMVLMQPYVKNCLTIDAPFRWKEDLKEVQVKRILNTLEIAQKSKSYFIVFPEYSIPYDAIEKIENFINSSDYNPTIIIGGIEGLNKEQYLKLCESFSTIDKIPEDYEWINCCITWVKDQKGTINRWVQPKLNPAWPEKSIAHDQMFKGDKVFLFKGKCHRKAFRFFSLICFDWIGKKETNKISGVVDSINEIFSENGEDAKPIHLIFILQHNQDPEHYTFLQTARDFFTNSHWTFVNTKECTLIFANTAGGEKPGNYSEYGASCLIFSPNTVYVNKGCPPSFNIIGKKCNPNRKSSLGNCKEAVFREKGACIFSFNLKLPEFINKEPSDKTFPLENALVYSIDNNTNDPRAPNKPVPAVVKWVNDKIDEISPPIPIEDGNLKDGTSEERLYCQYCKKIKGRFNEVCERIRYSDSKILEKALLLAASNITEDFHNSGLSDITVVDLWKESAKKALEGILYSISVISVKYIDAIENTLKNENIHTIFKLNLSNNPHYVVDVIIISGTCQDILERIKQVKDILNCSLYESGRRKLLFVFYTNDLLNKIILEKRLKNIHEPENYFKWIKYSEFSNAIEKNFKIGKLKEKIQSLITEVLNDT